MNRLRWGLPFLSGLLFWSSFAPLDWGVLAWVSLVPLLLYAKLTSGWRSFLVAWLAGAVTFAAGFFWLRHTVPAGPYLLGLYTGLYAAVFVLLVRRLGTAWAPVAWVALEVVRGRLFTGMPWLLLGYTQHPWPVFYQIADVGGVWLVSGLVVLVNAALVERCQILRTGAVAAVLLSTLYGAARIGTIPITEGPKISVIQPNIPQDLKMLQLEQEDQARENYEKHLFLTLQAAEGKPDLVVWPEAAIYRGIVYNPERKRWAETPWYRRVVDAGCGVPAIVGLLVQDVREKGGRIDWDSAEITNSALLVHPDRGVEKRFDKVHLVPFAESFPLGTRELVMKWSGLRIAEMRPGAEFPVWEAGGAGFGLQICFEAIFPEISREIAGKGGRFSVNISNDGWFRDSAELDQMLAMARFRAVESRIGFIRATNTGISAFIDPVGRVHALIPEKEVEGVLTARVKVTEAKSLYLAWGNVPAWLAVLAVAVATGRRIFVDRKNRVA